MPIKRWISAQLPNQDSSPPFDKETKTNRDAESAELVDGSSLHVGTRSG